MAFKLGMAARLALAVAVLCSVSLSLDLEQAARAEEPARPLADGPETKDGREFSALRTRTSRTFQYDRGSFVTVVKPGSINFQDAQGQWQPIDNTLVSSAAAGYALENKSNRYRLRLPARLGTAPVRVELGNDWLTFALDKADGPGSAQGATQTYAGALPETTVAYTAFGDGVKEAILLRSEGAPSSFAFRVRTSPGLSARPSGRGGIEFVDASGASVFSFEPPWMRDARVGKHRPECCQGYIAERRRAGRVPPRWRHGSLPTYVNERPADD